LEARLPETQPEEVKVGEVEGVKEDGAEGEGAALGGTRVIR